MGKLETTIILHDKVSKQLNNINRSINRTVNAMTRLNNVNSNAVNGINTALTRQIKHNDTIMKQLGRWAVKLRNISTIYFGIRGAIQGINSAVRLSDKMTMNDAKLNLVSGGDPKLKNELEGKTFAAAQRSTTDYLEFTKAVGKLGILAGDKFKNNDSIVRFVELMNKSFQISGAETSERNAAMLQITQAIASNRLQGDEFRSILENAPMVMEALTKSLGVGHDKLKAMAKEGEITADVLIKAMFDAGKKIEDMYKTLPMTWERHWAKLKNVGVVAFKPINEQLTRLFNSKKFQSLLNDIGTLLIFIGNVGGWIFGKLLDFIDWVSDKFIQFKNSIHPAAISLKALIAAVVTYVAVSKTLTLVTAAFNAMKGAIMGVNLAMSLNPVGLIIAGVVLLIALFYGAVAAVNHFAGTSYNAAALIAGYFSMAFAQIYNTFVFVWNWISSAVEFWVNVWKHPLYSVKKLFANLVTNILDFCIAMTKGWDDTANNFAKFMIDAINLVIKAWNKFIDMLPETVVTKLGLAKGDMASAKSISNVANKLENAKSSVNKLIGDKPEDYKEIKKLEYKTLSNAAKNGYDKIDNLTKATVGGQKLTADALNGINNKLGDIGDVGAKTAKNTGDTAKNTSDKTDFSYLRNWAYNKGMGSSIGYNIKIEQNNQNRIGNNMDLNRVVDAIRDAILEGVYNGAERSGT